MAPAGVAPAAASPAASRRRDDDWRPALVALEQNLRREMAQVQADRRPRRSASRSGRARPTPRRVLRRVQAMVDESEQRQRQELALRLTQSRPRLEHAAAQPISMNINQRFGALQGADVQGRGRPAGNGESAAARLDAADSMSRSHMSRTGSIVVTASRRRAARRRRAAQTPAAAPAAPPRRRGRSIAATCGVRST